MNTVEIPEKDLCVEYPSCWEELNLSQFKCVMKNWLKLMDGKINVNEFYIIVLYDFLGMKRQPFHEWKEKRLSKQQLEDKFANIWQLTTTLHWLLKVEGEGKNTVILLNYPEIRNRYPELCVNYSEIFYGPGDALLDVTFGEYRRAWTHFEAYSKFHKDADLNRFIATLYRPLRYDYNKAKKRPDFDGIKKEAFNPWLTSHYADVISKVPFWLKHVIYLWFFNCDKYLKEQELEIDGNPICFAPLFQKNAGNSDVEVLDETELGLTGLLYFVAESKLFGGIDEVDKVGYVDVLTGLIYWKQQADKIK